MPCLLPDTFKEVKELIRKNGGFYKLRSMTADERIKMLAPVVDIQGQTTTAEWLNRQIEQRILVKNDTQALVDWLNNRSKGKPNIDKDVLYNRIKNKKEIFNPVSKNRFAEGLAKQVMGFSINDEDSKTLFDLSNSINQLKTNLLNSESNYLKLTTEELNNLEKTNPVAYKNRVELGKKLVEFQHTYESISLKAQALDFKNKGIIGKVWESLLNIAGNIKSLKASVDFSFLRQLQSTAYVHIDSFKDAMKKGYNAWFSSQEGVDTLLADILTRPNSLNGNYNFFGIEVGIREEAFPESWLSKALDKAGMEKLNLLRRSEAGFNIAIQTARANLFDWMWEQSKGDRELLKSQGVGKAINTVTGRGQNVLLTPKDPGYQRVINNLLFAPKWLASRIQSFTDLIYMGEIGKKSPKGIRARASVMNLIMIATCLALRRLLWGLGDDDDKRDVGTFLNPTSSDFGKIIIGNTRFDLTASTANLITVTARLWEGEYMNSKGQVRKMKPMNALTNFLKGKRSPGLSTAIQLKNIIIERQPKNFFGKEITYGQAINEAISPISIQNIIELSLKENEDNLDYWGEVAGVLSDIIGIGSNTYDNKK